MTSRRSFFALISAALAAPKLAKTAAKPAELGGDALAQARRDNPLIAYSAAHYGVTFTVTKEQLEADPIWAEIERRSLDRLRLEEEFYDVWVQGRITP